MADSEMMNMLRKAITGSAERRVVPDVLPPMPQKSPLLGGDNARSGPVSFMTPHVEGGMGLNGQPFDARQMMIDMMQHPGTPAPRPSVGTAEEFKLGTPQFGDVTEGTTVGAAAGQPEPQVPMPAGSSRELPYQTYERVLGRKWTGGKSDSVKQMLSNFGITATPGSPQANIELQNVLLSMKE